MYDGSEAPVTMSLDLRSANSLPPPQSDSGVCRSKDTPLKEYLESHKRTKSQKQKLEKSCDGCLGNHGNFRKSYSI